MTDKKADRLIDYIADILTAVARIQKYTAGMLQSEFIENSLVQDAVIRNLEIIGEAANKIQKADPAFAQQHPGLRLDLAYRMRNALIHGYDSIDLITVWNTIQQDLPVLQEQAAKLLVPPFDA